MGGMDFSSFRKEYTSRTLSREDLLPHPLDQFALWLKEAEGLSEPNAMQLATFNNGRPSLRTVLLKELSEKGFVFYTSYAEPKSA